jgi:hypothetical protein
MFHEEECIDHSLSDCKTMGGAELNIQCGKKTTVEDVQFVQSSIKSPDKLKKGSLINGDQGVFKRFEFQQFTLQTLIR